MEAFGKAKPFRTSGGRAALGCYLSGALRRPYADHKRNHRSLANCAKILSRRKGGLLRLAHAPEHI